MNKKEKLITQLHFPFINYVTSDRNWNLRFLFCVFCCPWSISKHFFAYTIYEREWEMVEACSTGCLEFSKFLQHLHNVAQKLHFFYYFCGAWIEVESLNWMFPAAAAAAFSSSLIDTIEKYFFKRDAAKFFSLWYNCCELR